MKKLFALIFCLVVATSAGAQRGGSRNVSSIVMQQCADPLPRNCPAENYVCRDAARVIQQCSGNVWTASAGASVTIEEADGSPSVAAVTVLQFDQAEGFTVTDEGGGQAQIDLADIYVLIAGDSMTGPLLLDNESQLRFGENDANGANYIEFLAPAIITSNQTCTLEDDLNPIPDSCVGDGEDSTTPAADEFINLTGGDGITNAAGTLHVDLNTTIDGVGVSTSLSGLEFTATNELALIQGCADAQGLVWTDATSQWDCGNVGGGTGAFNDGADPVVLQTTTKDVSIGASHINTSKLSVDGDADQVQFTVQCDATQTDSCVIIENSAGVEQVNIEADGDIKAVSIQDIAGTPLWSIDTAGDAIFNTVTTAPSANPSWDFNDSDFAGTESRIQANANADNNGELSFEVEEAADTFFVGLTVESNAGAVTVRQGGVVAGNYVQTTEAGDMSAQGTATITATDLAADGVDAISEIDAGIKRGPDATDTHILTTDVAAPGALTCLNMDTDGSVVLAAGACAAAGAGDVGDVGPGCADGACWTDTKVTTGTTMWNWEGTVSNTDDFFFTVPADPDFDVNWVLTQPTVARTQTFPDASGEFSLLGQTIEAAEVAADVATQAEIEAQDECSEITGCVVGAITASSTDTLTNKQFNDDTELLATSGLCFQDTTGGDQYCFESEGTAPAGTAVYQWNIDPATCTGDGNAGALTVVGAGPYTIECSADDGGGASTTWDLTDTDASPILTVDDTEQVQFIGGTGVTVTAAADGSNHDVTIASHTIFTPNADPGVDHSGFAGGIGITETAGSIAFAPAEVASVTWLDNADRDWTFDIAAAGVNPEIHFAADQVEIDADLQIDDGKELRLLEPVGAGTNYIAIVAPATIGANRTCTLEDDATPFDPCITSGGGMTSFNIDGDDNDPRTITNGEEALFTGGVGIDTNTEVGDEITFTFDAAEVDAPTWGDGTSSIWTFDVGAVDPLFEFSSGNVKFSGATTYTFEGGATDPIWTPGSGTMNLTTGTLQQASTDVCLADGTQCEPTLTDIADGTIAENLVNTANPWADDEVSDNLTVATRAAADCTTETGGVTNELCVDSSAGAGSGIWRCPSPGDCNGTTAWERVDDTSGGAPAFSAITTGTNTDATGLFIGTAGSLSATGTGTIVATGVDAVGAAAVVIGSPDVTELTLDTDLVTIVEADLAIIDDSVITLSGTEVAGILDGANGGTNNGFMDFTGPATSLKTFTLPNASSTILTDNADVTVAQGGTGLSAGTSGGILGFTATGTLASTAALGAGNILVGGGAGVVPTSVAAGATTEILVGGGASTAPVWTTATGSGAPVRAVSPALTTDPTAPTAASGDSDTSIATTDFVDRRTQHQCKTIESLVAADDNVYMDVFRAAVTIVAVACQSQAAATVVLEDFGGTAIETIVCETDGAIAWDTTISGTATLISGEVMQLDTTSASSPTWTMVCWEWTND